MSTLVAKVREDVFSFLRSNNELLFNERDFQIHLATWFRNSANAYEDVDVEYYVPWQELKDYVWKSELRLDVVVKKDGEYCPVELKYKTKKVERHIARFDEQLKKSVAVMKDQGAQDIGMYDFWKDVRRVELVRNRFDRVKGGLAVFVTNDASYKKESKETSNNFQFCMTEGKPHTKQKHWLNPESTCAKTHPNFEVEKEYNIKWNQQTVDGVDFYYCIVTI